MYTYCMSRAPLPDVERAWGRRLAQLLREGRARADVSAERLAVMAGVSVETVRRIERGHVPSPGFFTIAVLGQALNIGLDDLAAAAQSSGKRTERS